MAKAKSNGSDAASGEAAPSVPPVEQWTAPMAWAGPALKPVENWSREFPANAAFVRGELVLTLAEETGPGMTRQMERAVPALIRLEKGKPVEAHAPGPDSRCWTYRAEKDGRKTRWRLYTGDTYPATRPAADHWTAPWRVEYAILQSVMPEYGSGKYISLMIREDGSVENLTRAKDPDPND